MKYEFHASLTLAIYSNFSDRHKDAHARIQTNAEASLDNKSSDMPFPRQCLMERLFVAVVSEGNLLSLYNMPPGDSVPMKPP